MGGGFGARGEIERSDQNDSTRRIVSIRTARSMAVALNLITLAVYLVIFLYWWFVLIQLYEPAPRASSFSRWWGCTRFVSSTWGQSMGQSWPLWLIPLALEWVKPQWELYRHNLRPKLYNDNWPPPSAQMDPNKSGFVTAANWDDRAGVGVAVAQDAPKAQIVTLEIVEGPTRRYLTDIELTPELQRFCRGVVDGSVTFSEGGADSCDWPKSAFKGMRDQMIERGFIAWKNEGNTRSGYYFHPIAWRALEELATLPLPHSRKG